MTIKFDKELIKIYNEPNYSCYGCSYFCREYENNDVWCNCRKSRYYKDNPPGEPCEYWKAKE